jgi:hypothetical protein
MANHNGKTQPITPIPRFERLKVSCQRCKRPFENFTLEVINNLVQLRCGDVLIPRLEAVCLHCGCVFYWNVREKDLEKMATSYKELLGLIKPYAPE